MFEGFHERQLKFRGASPDLSRLGALDLFRGPGPLNVPFYDMARLGSSPLKLTGRATRTSLTVEKLIRDKKVAAASWLLLAALSRLPSNYPASIWSTMVEGCYEAESESGQFAREMVPGSGPLV